MKAVLQVEIDFDARLTTAAAVAAQLDKLLTEALKHYEWPDEFVSDTEGSPGVGRPTYEPDVPELLHDGEYTEGDLVDAPNAAAHVLPLVRRRDAHTDLLLVCNRHKQDWLQIYLDYWGDRLRLMVHDTRNNGGNETPIIDRVLCRHVYDTSGEVLVDEDGDPMPVLPELVETAAATKETHGREND